jgi:aminobenzoyl-glutamate utilization protein B
MNALFKRVTKIAEGAALMTETSVDVEVDKACSNMLGNDPLEQAMQANLEAFGAPPFDAADRDAAARFHATVSAEDIASGATRYGVAVPDGAVLHEGVVPWTGERKFMAGSTDVGDVSWVVPTAQVWTACYTLGTPGHSWQLTGQGRLPAAHKGMTQAAKIMAATVVDTLLDPALLARAKAEHAARTAATPYVCPILEGVVAPCSR